MLGLCGRRLTGQRMIRDASRACCGLMTQYFVEEWSEIVDAGKRVTHRALADRLHNKLDDAKFFHKLKIKKFDPSQLDWALHPKIKSGDSLNAKRPDPDDNQLHPGIVMCLFGLRYQTYGALLGRTFMVDPNKTQEGHYKLLLSIHDLVLKSIKDGVVAKDIYQKALSHLKAKKPELQGSLMKNLGHVVGIESRDLTFAINPRCGRQLRDGMTLAVSTGLYDLKNPQAKNPKDAKYSLLLTDTVRVTHTDAAVFTKDAAADFDSATFFFKDDSEPERKPKAKRDSRIGAVAVENVTTTRTRGGNRPVNGDAEKEAQRAKHQAELHEQKQQQGLAKYKGTAAQSEGEERRIKRFESFKRENQIAPPSTHLSIYVDKKNLSIVVPIMGRAVPFHIYTIKNVASAREGEYTSLRINFLSPGSGVSKKDDQPFEDPTAHFMRSLTFRSLDKSHMEDLAAEIMELKKDVVRREQEKKQMEDVVEQEKLITIKSRCAPASRRALTNRSQTGEARHDLPPPRHRHEARGRPH